MAIITYCYKCPWHCHGMTIGYDGMAMNDRGNNHGIATDDHGMNMGDDGMTMDYHGHLWHCHG